MTTTAPIVREADCPQADQHAPSPDGYLAWHAWAQRMSKTHRQVRCPGCGLWAVWVPKLDRTPAPVPAAPSGPAPAETPPAEPTQTPPIPSRDVCRCGHHRAGHAFPGGTFGHYTSCRHCLGCQKFIPRPAEGRRA